MSHLNKNNKLEIAIIGTVGLPAKYGGFETLADQLVRNLRDNFDFTVYCSSKSYDHRLNEFSGAKLVYFPFHANGVQSTIYDIVAILHAVPRSDTLLILGVSGCIILPMLKLVSKKKIIVNIDGLEWTRAKWNSFAKGFLKLSERITVKYADVIIADNTEIQKYVHNEYKKKSVMIEYGGDHAKPNRNIDVYKNEFAFLNKQYAFGICRIEPENNVHLILEAFTKVGNVPFAMVGNWDNSTYGKELKAKYSNSPNIYLIDAIYDQEKLDALRSNCSYYLHGHSAGGTNPSLVEAMHLGLSIISFDVSYNRETTENKAVYFKDIDELVNVIRERDKYDFKKISEGMTEIAERRYNWHVITNKYAALF